MQFPKKDESALDSIEHELYDPRHVVPGTMVHQTRSSRMTDLPSSWGADTPIIKIEQTEKGLSFGAKLLVAASIILFVSLSFTAWRVLSSRNIVSSANIDVTLGITPYIEGGEVTPLTVSINNRNSTAIESVTATLMYTKGSGSQDETEKVNQKRDLGTLAANAYSRQDFQVSVYGKESESRDITVKLEYKVAGSNATFSKTVTTAVVLKTSPIGIHIDGPTSLSSGQSATYTFTIKNNTSTTTADSVFALTLPSAFIVTETTPKSTNGNVWHIDPLAPGDSKTITVSGSLTGTQGEISTLKAQVGSQGTSPTNIGVVYESQTFDTLLKLSPLTLSIGVDTERGSADNLRYGDKTTLTLTYTNTSDQTVTDAQIQLSITGNAALYGQVNPDVGYYDSIAKTITWNKSSITDLAILAPHATGVFRVIIPIVLSGNNSPSLKLVLSGAGTAVTKNDVTALVTKTLTVQGSVSITAATAYKNSQFKNNGPIPPIANTQTSYTAHIVVSAQNALSNTKVSFVLPGYVTWLNASSDPTHISYDTRTRTVLWNVGSLDAGKTTFADIQISVKPSQSQIGSSPAITSGIVLDADEQVSRAHINTTISGLTTFIKGESWPTNPSLVVGQ
jgi:hypothetical protein